MRTICRAVPVSEGKSDYSVSLFSHIISKCFGVNILLDRYCKQTSLASLKFLVNLRHC